jgi:hypothetical protein
LLKMKEWYKGVVVATLMLFDMLYICSYKCTIPRIY